MRSILIISIFLMSKDFAFSQERAVTYYGEIESIISRNCMPCHSPGQSGPFSLVSFEDVIKRADFIGHVTKNGYMPPWKADREFQAYKNERGLTSDEIEAIQTWLKNGMPKGKKNKKESQPKSQIETPDLTLRIKKPYLIPTSNKDDYRFFYIPTNLPEDKYLSKIEFIPDNKRLVHHSRLMTDTTHQISSIDGMSADDPGISAFEKYPPLDKFLYGWVPGNSAIEFPSGTGKKIFRDTDLILNVHYAPNSRENQYDQSTINFYFTKEKANREVYSLAIAENNISNPPFVIPAGEKKTFYSSFGPIPIDISVVGVLPHMHYIGKTFRAFAVTAEGEAIRLIKIDNWDFKWQETYLFKKLQVIPKNSVILIEATFDNSAENPANPNSPPKEITYGWNTTSEMLDLVLYYLEYKEGDENKSND